MDGWMHGCLSEEKTFPQFKSLKSLLAECVVIKCTRNSTILMTNTQRLQQVLQILNIRGVCLLWDTRKCIAHRQSHVFVTSFQRLASSNAHVSILLLWVTSSCFILLNCLQKTIWFSRPVCSLKPWIPLKRRSTKADFLLSTGQN